MTARVISHNWLGLLWGVRSLDTKSLVSHLLHAQLASAKTFFPRIFTGRRFRECGTHKDLTMTTSWTVFQRYCFFE